LLTISDNRQVDYLKSGIVMERMWLKATELQIGLHPMTGAVYLFERLKDKNLGGLSPSLSEALGPVHQQFQNIFPNIQEGHHPTFLFRLVFAEEPEIRSLRRSLYKVFFTG
jgi:hypothetical protein